MTLDIHKYFKNLIDKEATISHFQMKTYAGKTGKMRPNFQSSIEKEYGEGYLQDADYVLFFEKDEPWNKDSIKKLFELTNRALGKDANKLSQSDFNYLPTEASAQPEDAAQPEEGAEDDEAQEQAQDDNAKASNTLFLKITIK